MIYAEVIVSAITLTHCAVCQKLIRWPEEVRCYARTLNGRVERVEHATHPPLEGSKLAGRKRRGR